MIRSDNVGMMQGWKQRGFRFGNKVASLCIGQILLLFWRARTGCRKYWILLFFILCCAVRLVPAAESTGSVHFRQAGLFSEESTTLLLVPDHLETICVANVSPCLNLVIWCGPYSCSLRVHARSARKRRQRLLLPLPPQFFATFAVGVLGTPNRGKPCYYGPAVPPYIMRFLPIRRNA